MRETFVRLHSRGGYFRIRGYGFLVLVTHHPLYGMRHRLHNEHNIGPLWWKILRPDTAHRDGTACAGDPHTSAEAP